MKNILIVEDERSINQLIFKSLQTVGYTCFQAFYGMEALAVLQNQAIDLVILDVQLPDTDGFSLIRSIPELPVIYLTARDGVEDRVKGLTLGAEDYIVKPFALDELLARVQVVLRRFHAEEDVTTIQDVTIDCRRREVRRKNRIVELTPQEFSLLEVFLRNKNMALTREQLLQQAWGYDFLGDERTVDVHVQRLRKKLGFESVLVTVYKLGYRLEVM